MNRRVREFTERIGRYVKHDVRNQPEPWLKIYCVGRHRIADLAESTMTKLATKLACTTVCLLLLCIASRSEAASPTDQEGPLTDQQMAKVRELINDTIQPSIDAINRKIDTLVGVIQANHLKSERGAQDEQIADYKTRNNDERNNDDREHTYNNDEGGHKYVERQYVYIYCCRPHWYHCCRPHHCKPRCDNCYRPHWNHCYRRHYHYCRLREDDP